MSVFFLDYGLYFKMKKTDQKFLDCTKAFMIPRHLMSRLRP